VALENGWANERRIAARGEVCRQELRKQRCRPEPVQHLRCRRDGTGNRAHAGFNTATHRVVALRATGVLRRIRVRNGRGLAIRRHRWGDSRKRDHRPLQTDGEHHDESNKLALHTQKRNCRSAPKQIIGPESIVPGNFAALPRSGAHFTAGNHRCVVSMSFSGNTASGGRRR
jgi:hypothetical protein